MTPILTYKPKKTMLKKLTNSIKKFLLKVDIEGWENDIDDINMRKVRLHQKLSIQIEKNAQKMFHLNMQQLQIKKEILSAKEALENL